ncbi:hypothetical protein LPJ66_006206 [Kickxella alabastrina]|uniref:Uncharacterized protein n=1 Tax=Kickxella alabastrina TaxID=61397 RepID=A0ACC1ICX6_9FUNG|nr:hypothetical protein LPJ66_006206 [Kickxella alabastrina]
MSRLNESSGTASTGNNDQARNDNSSGNNKRQSRFQGHWDAAPIRPSNQALHYQPDVSQSAAAVSANTESYDYSWDLLVSGNKPTTPATAMGLQTFASSIDDDWSNLLKQLTQLTLL